MTIRSAGQLLLSLAAWPMALAAFGVATAVCIAAFWYPFKFVINLLGIAVR